MLEAAKQEILGRLSGDDLVLDVGGWAKPFARADWVIDMLPHETRGLYGYDQGSAAEERFSADTWVQRDMCAREPWPFADDQFDFVTCSHTLEDVRDPIWVCAEIMRVGRAGYVEVPSRLEEQTFGIQGPWVGWGHHHWLIDRDGDELTFVFKPHMLNGWKQCQFPRRFHATLTAEEKVEQLFWEGGFRASERVFIGEGLDEYLSALVRAHLGDSEPEPERAGRLRKALRRGAGR